MENETKSRILYLYQHLIQNTDIDHPQSTVELTGILKEKYDISVSRNTISNDLYLLHKCDSRIKIIHSTQNKYYFDGQLFDVPELKILIDAISSSKFITTRKSKKLIDKLLSLAPSHTAIGLKRHIYVTDRIKSENESAYYIVDAINDAIEKSHMITFYYMDYDINGHIYISNNGNPYTVSPYALIWNGDYYYLRGYCDERQAMRTFRLDRIKQQPQILPVPAHPKPPNYNLAEFNKSVFRMYDTDHPLEVTLLCHVQTMKSIVDRFGPKIKTFATDDSHFRISVTVCTSPTFYRWVFGFGGDIKILKPQNVIDEYREMARKALEL